MNPRCESMEEMISRYGKPWESSSDFEQNHMTLWTSKIWCSKNPELNWKPSFNRIYCNRDMIPAMDVAFTNLHLKNFIEELKTFDGCWNIRRVRGDSSVWSIHSFALALDFNASENKLGFPHSFSEGFLRCFEAAGFTAGARFPRQDGMHFQFAGRF